LIIKKINIETEVSIFNEYKHLAKDESDKGSITLGYILSFTNRGDGLTSISPYTEINYTDISNEVNINVSS